MGARFPIPPGVVARVVQAAADPDTRIADLTRLLETDAVLSSQVLRSVNSACFGLRHKVASVERAIAIMGMRAVRNLALSMGVRDLVPVQAIGAFPLDVFWECSLRRAAAAQCLAERLELPHPEEYFTLGLCQDIGVLARLRDDAGLAERLGCALHCSSDARLAIERDGGDGHDRTGHDMFVEWSFPAELAVPLLHHHAPGGAPEAHRRRAEVAHAAEAIADLSTVRDKREARQAAVERLGPLGLPEEALGPVVDRVNDLVREFAELIGLEIDDLPSYDEIVAAASQGLVDLNLSYEDLTRKLEETLAEQQRMAEQLSSLNDELARQARTDALTGIANRRSFDEALHRELAVAQRQSAALSLLVVDIDHFKSLNDAHGHQAGDSVLRAVGHAIGDQARTTDFAARYGGEEFAVILPFTDHEGGLIAAERHRKRIEDLVVPHNGLELRVTVSIGGATLSAVPLPQSHFALGLVEQADRVLYRAKQAGRNRVCWDDDEAEVPELASTSAGAADERA